MSQKIIKYLSFEDFQKIYKKCKDKKLKLAILLGFGSGLRISEIVGFQRKQRQRKNKITGKTEIFKDSSSIPPLTQDRVDLKKHQIRIEDAKGGKWRITITPPNLNEEMLKILPLKIDRRTLQNQFNRLTEKVLGKKYHFHTLRHGFGNYQANVLKVSLPIVQQMMGHSRLDTTGIYTKVNPEFAISQAWKAMTGEGE